MLESCILELNGTRPYRNFKGILVYLRLDGMKKELAVTDLFPNAIANWGTTSKVWQLH
jgi:hypothetical protein